MASRRTRAFVRAYTSDSIEAVRNRLGKYTEAQLQRAADRALVSMIRRVQPIAKRDVRARYGVRASVLNGAFRVVRGKSRKGDPYIGVWASSRRVSLIEFGGRWRKKAEGATAQVLLGQSRTYKHSFIADVQGLRAIRVRSFVKGSTTTRAGRGPLRMLRGPSPLEMLLGEDMKNGSKVGNELTAIYAAEIRRQMKLLGETE